MSEIENQTQQARLADRITQAARSGESVSAFHDEINNLTNDERLQLVRDLSRNSATSNNGQRRLFVDATIDKTNGQLVDIDLVDVNNDTGSRTRRDLYTPGEAGQQYDRRQQIQARTAPYEELFQLTLEEDPNISRSDAFFQTADFFNKDFRGRRDYAELYRVFKERTLRPDVNRFEPVVPSDSAAANRPDLANASPGVRQEISEIRRNLDSSSTLYGRQSW